MNSSAATPRPSTELSPTVSPMAQRISCRSPLPLARAITIAPPVATDRNTSVTNALIVPTILAAAMAASPVLATIAVESTLIKQMKN